MILRPSEALRLSTVVVALAVASVLAFSLAWRLPRNTLEFVPDWVSTKTTLSRAVMGAFNFVMEPQALAGGVLDLGAWYGFQELRLEHALSLDELELSFELDEGAWLGLLLAPPSGDAWGLQLSRDPATPARHFRATEVGRIDDSVLLPHAGDLDGGWHRLRLVRERDAFRVLLDDEELLEGFADARIPLELRLRGGRRSARIDRVRLRDASGQQIDQGFDQHLDVGSEAISIGLVVLVLNGLFYFVGSLRSGDEKRVLFGLVLLNGVLLVLAGSLAGALYYRGSTYAALDELMLASERYWRGSEADAVVQRIRARTASSPPEQRRILFLGSSQTWGAGAREESEVWVHRVEETLRGRGESVACLNGGVSSAKSDLVLELYRDEWAALSPETVVIDLGNNDGDAEALAGNLDAMLRLAAASGSAALVVLEPNSREVDRAALHERHDVLRKVADEHGVEVVDMQAHLEAREDDGFLWWDSVHLTSYGQELFADRIVQALSAPEGAAVD